MTIARPSITQAIEETFRDESSKVLAALIGKFNDFELAEEVVQEAFIIALEKWQDAGIPPNPGGWIMTTARNKAIDLLRRSDNLSRKMAVLQDEAEREQRQSLMQAPSQAPLPIDEDFPDERLKLVFTCCHPALAQDAQVALTLRTLGGLSTEEIAAAYLCPQPTMAQRLVRAKRKIKKAGIPYKVPEPEQLAERMNAVHTTLYLIFNEGYSASSGNVLVRRDLCQEAIRLTRLLVELLSGLVTASPGQSYTTQLQPSHQTEAMGLLALMLLQFSRRDARLSTDGSFVTLEEQDRSLWDAQAIDEGLTLLQEALQRRQPGPYQIQAAIAALHARAATPDETDWPQIALLYGELYKRNASPIVLLNQAVAVAMAKGPHYGPQQGLAMLEQIETDGDLQEYYLFHATRADLLRRTSSFDDAVESYETALNLAENDIEKSYLERRIGEVQELQTAPNNNGHQND